MDAPVSTSGTQGRLEGGQKGTLPGSVAEARNCVKNVKCVKRHKKLVKKKKSNILG